MAQEPHFALFVQPKADGSTHDYSIFKSTSSSYSRYLHKTPQELHDCTGDNDKRWAMLGDNGYQGPDSDTPTVRRIFVPRATAATDITLQNDLKKLRVPVECFFGRLKHLWQMSTGLLTSTSMPTSTSVCTSPTSTSGGASSSWMTRSLSWPTRFRTKKKWSKKPRRGSDSRRSGTAIKKRSWRNSENLTFLTCHTSSPSFEKKNKTEYESPKRRSSPQNEVFLSKREKPPKRGQRFT